MNDLISRQAAIDAAIEAADDWDGGCSKVRERFIRDALEELPSAQPEIIRCKECLWRIGRDCTRFTDLPVYMDDYCGRAKRRTDE